MKYRHFLIAVIVLWIAAVFVPGLPAPVGVIVYVAIPLVMVYAAFKHRSAGWLSGVILAALLLTLPLWVGWMYAMYERWRK